MEDPAEVLKKILEQPPLPLPSDGPEELLTVPEAVQESFPKADEKTKEILARALQSQMPSPEEIRAEALRDQHNKMIAKRRQEDLARRAARRAAGLSTSPRPRSGKKKRKR